MKLKNKILTALLVSFSLILISASLPLVNAEIIWSLPTEVPFYISGNNTYENQTLIINIISPKAKTYNFDSFPANIPLEISTNLNSSCYYKLNNQAWVSLGKGFHFFKTLSLDEGEYTLSVWCRAGNKELVKTLNFEVSDDDDYGNSYTKKKLAEDEEYERNLKTIKYGDWICINNKLQRTVTINGLQDVEYGQACGFEIGPESSKKKLSILIIIPIIFLILILILIVLIALAISRD